MIYGVGSSKVKISSDTEMPIVLDDYTMTTDLGVSLQALKIPIVENAGDITIRVEVVN